MSTFRATAVIQLLYTYAIAVSQCLKNTTIVFTYDIFYLKLQELYLLIVLKNQKFVLGSVGDSAGLVLCHLCDYNHLSCDWRLHLGLQLGLLHVVSSSHSCHENSAFQES